MHVANPRPKRPSVGVIDAIANESELGVFGGNDVGKSFAWELGKPLSGYSEQLHGNLDSNVNNTGSIGYNSSNDEHKSPYLYGMNLDLHNLLPRLQPNDNRNRYGGSAPPMLENEFDDGSNDFSIGSTRVLSAQLQNDLNVNNMEGDAFSPDRNKSGLLIHERESGTIEGRVSNLHYSDDEFLQQDRKKGMRLSKGYVTPPGISAPLDGGGHSGSSHTESKPTDYFDSAFYDPPSFVRSSSAPMYSLDIPSETWGNDTTSVPSHGGATSSSNQIGVWSRGAQRSYVQ